MCGFDFICFQLQNFSCIINCLSVVSKGLQTQVLVNRMPSSSRMAVSPSPALQIAFICPVALRPCPLRAMRPNLSARKSPRRHLRLTCLADSFQAAVEKGYVRDFGRVVRLDDDARAAASTDLQLPHEHQEAFRTVRDLIVEQARPQCVRAVFVRGSIVSGYFFDDGRSDVDLVIFTDTCVPGPVIARLRHGIHDILRRCLRLCGTDVTFRCAQPGQNGKRVFDVNSAMQILLRHYAVPLHGSLLGLDLAPAGADFESHVAMDIRNDERRFLAAMADGDPHVQLVALQWLCKRCLRAVADLCCRTSKVHCRDLVPCYQAGVARYPQHARTLLLVLQVACACPENQLAGLTMPELLGQGAIVAAHAVELVEDLFLQARFHPSECNIGRLMESPPAITAMDRSPAVLLRGVAEQCVASLRFYMPSSRPKHKDRKPFLRSELPHLALRPVNSVKERKCHDISLQKQSSGSLTPLLTEDSEPVVFRNAGYFCQVAEMDTDAILEKLVQTNITAECRVSAGNVVTFCRSQHAWIDEELFTPPSVVKSLDIYDAIERLQVDNRFEQYERQPGQKEHIYIQTSVARNLQLFKDTGVRKVATAQSERVWISTHGTVSSLHYDASHSALFQRAGRKRMVFFPRLALGSLGVYPLGHPLHRRARVDLSNATSPLFHEFWHDWAHQVVDVVVNAGDLLLFPPGWAHYTESLAGHDKELSISHTFRYWSVG